MDPPTIFEHEYHLSEAEAKERYGDRLVERLDQTREVRHVNEHSGNWPKG